MAQRPKTTVRKLVTLSLDTAERVDKFRARTGAPSESDALKALVEGGLSRFDTYDDLFSRCQKATEASQSIGDLITSVTADHPLVISTSVMGGSLYVTLRKNDPTDEDEPQFRFRFRRDAKEWSWERLSKRDEDWMVYKPYVEATAGGGRPSARSNKAELDDDIPF